jgi:uncharacterized membrane protein
MQHGALRGEPGNNGHVQSVSTVARWLLSRPRGEIIVMTNTGYTPRYKEVSNVNEVERWASLIGGGTLVAFGLMRRKWDGYLMAAIGGGLVAHGATPHSTVYRMLGVHTDRRSGRNVAVPYELGVRVDKSIIINKPVAEVYGFWRNLENLPKFMRNLESVQEIDNKHSHWVARMPVGASLQWNAEIVSEKENELIGWRSLPGADVANAGSVRFDQTPDGRGTIVRLELQYDPPGGNLGAMLAKMMGSDPARRIEEDLRNLKQLLETGEIPTTKGQPAGRRSALAASGSRQQPPKKAWNRDVVTTASEESFPASDPPSWTPEQL